MYCVWLLSLSIVFGSVIYDEYVDVISFSFLKSIALYEVTQLIYAFYCG